jgi:dimethylglycine dehydrogenase
VDKALALCMLRSDLTEPGTRVEVEIFGERFPATVQPGQAVWDPENQRIRA